MYLGKVAAKHQLGIDLASLRLEGQEMPFEGSYSIEAPHGTVVFYTQGGRLVAIAFADDVCLVAKSPDEAQILMHHAQYYYVSASATLCAPKSVWTGTKTPDPWKIELRLHDQATVSDYQSLEGHCRAWRRGRAAMGATRPPPGGVECRLGSSIIKTASPKKPCTIRRHHLKVCPSSPFEWIAVNANLMRC